MSYKLNGNWKAGWALDLHTLKSIPLGDGKFDTTYTEIGLSLNHLKYHQDYSQIDYLAHVTIEFLKTLMVTPYLNVIIPTPASIRRQVQPVEAIAEIISRVLNIPLDTNYLLKIKANEQLKGVINQNDREQILAGSFNVQDLRYRNKKILLFDDLYRSGTTLKAHDYPQLIQNVDNTSFLKNLL